MGVGAGLYMYDVVVKKFTFAISSSDEFLFLFKGPQIFECEYVTSRLHTLITVVGHLTFRHTCRTLINIFICKQS